MQKSEVFPRRLSPGQETLWLACCPRFSVVETSVAHEAPPCLQATLVTYTHCDPSTLAQYSGKASEWLDGETAYWACHAPRPQFLTIDQVVPSLFPRALLWNSSFGGTPEITNLKGVLPPHRLTENHWDLAKSTDRKIRRGP